MMWKSKGGWKRIRKLKGRMDKRGIMMCKLKGGCKRGHYDVQIKRVDGKGTL